MIYITNGYNSKELGVKLGDDALRRTNELEEEIIKKEGLPLATEKSNKASNNMSKEIRLLFLTSKVR